MEFNVYIEWLVNGHVAANLIRIYGQRKDCTAMDVKQIIV